MKRKQVGIIAFICVIIAVLLAFIVNLLFKIHVGGIFEYEQDSGDALAYVGTIFGSVSTFVLGYIAYKQNQKLQDMEDNNYIANNSSMLFVDEISIRHAVHIPVNYHLHCEQILTEDCDAEKCPSGYTFDIKASKIGTSVPAMIHISKCTLICTQNDGTISSALFGKSVDESFTRIAIGKDKLQFGMTFIVAQKNQAAFENAIQKEHYKLTAEFEFEIITDKYVATKCKCRSYCDYFNAFGNAVWKGIDPMVFFYGNRIYDKTSLKISGEEQENGKTENAFSK